MFPGITEANVYGVAVPGCDGHAGMASLVVQDLSMFNFQALFDFATQHLPSYARPLFLRVRTSENSKTSTFKFQKQEYMRQGFNPATLATDNTNDLLFFGHSSFATYLPLDTQLHCRIVNKAFRL